MNTLKVFGKFLDQPKLVKRFSQAVPAILTIGGTGFALYETHKAPKDKKKDTFIKNVAVLTGTVASAIAAPKITSKIIKGHHHHHNCHGHCHHKEVPELITDFLKENKVSEKVTKYLEDAKTKILGPKKIKAIFTELEKNPKSKEFLSGEEGLIPDPENIDSKHIFGEIGKLSVLGLIPVLGGITGGIVGDRITEKNWKEKIPNKIKEGSYQYLANIFLCNIGAGVALLAMEKAKVQSKAWRAVAMIGGIILTGLVGGSAMANYIGKKVIDPMFGKKDKGNLFSERKPEALDAGLHIDDIATVGVMSGLKWIEPALPILYSVSGYRAGIGYRNEHKHKHFYHLLHKFSYESNKKGAYSAFS